MNWNDDCICQPGLGQAIWYFRAKARRASPLLARSVLSLSGNLSPANICSRIWMQQVASLVITTLFYPFCQRQTLYFTAGSGSIDDAAQCEAGRRLQWPPPKWTRPSRNGSLAVFDCQSKFKTLPSEIMLTLMAVIASSKNGLCDGLFDKREI